MHLPKVEPVDLYSYSVSMDRLPSYSHLFYRRYHVPEAEEREKIVKVGIGISRARLRMRFAGKQMMKKDNMYSTSKDMRVRLQRRGSRWQLVDIEEKAP